MKLLKIELRMSGEKVDALGIRFYGDIDSEVKLLGRIGQMFSDLDMSPMIKHQKIILWFSFEKIHPYEKVSNFLSELLARLREEGYTACLHRQDICKKKCLWMDDCNLHRTRFS